MSIEDIQEIDKHTIKIVFVNDEVEEVLTLTIKKSELSKLKDYL